jgi:transcriptional regulator with XRE-family HTH domain
MLTTMTPSRIRKIRKALGFSQEDFAHILWVTWSTVGRWESGFASPTGIHLGILVLLDQRLTSRDLRGTFRDPRSADPMFVLYRLLEPLYADRRPLR